MAWVGALRLEVVAGSSGARGSVQLFTPTFRTVSRYCLPPLSEPFWIMWVTAPDGFAAGAGAGAGAGTGAMGLDANLKTYSAPARRWPLFQSYK
jgi:hypothetical protein